MVNRCREGCYLASKIVQHLEMNTCSRRAPIAFEAGSAPCSFLMSSLFLVVNDPCWTDHLCARWAVLLSHCSGDCMRLITVWHQERTWSYQRTVQALMVSGVCWDRRWGGCLQSRLFFAVLELHSGLSFTVIGKIYCCHEGNPLLLFWKVIT